MNISLHQAYNEFVTIALAVAAGYLGLIWVMTFAGNALLRFRKSKKRSSCRPGELVHQALKITGRAWDHYRTAALLFGVSFLLLVNFGRYGWWVPLPTIVNIAVTLVLAAPLVYGILKMLQLGRYRARLAKLLGLHNQVAARLVEAQLRGNRVFHSVKLGDAIIDNVIVGRNGIYTLQLFTPPRGGETVGIAQGGLVFLPSGSRSPLKGYGKSIHALTKALSEAAGGRITVQAVCVVPECKIEAVTDNGPILVSLEACTSFVGWQDEGAFLMDDDIATISTWLARQALEDPPHTLRAAVKSLRSQMSWPALVPLPPKRSKA
jgi:hypothetical protein